MMHENRDHPLSAAFDDHPSQLVSLRPQLSRRNGGIVSVKTEPTTDLVERVAAAIRSHNIETIVVDRAGEVRDLVLGMIPEGSEVHTGKSKTLEDVGLYGPLIEGGRYEAIRTKTSAMDRATQGREIRKLSAAPDFELGSVAAVTEDGTLVAASATGSQLGPYAMGAGRLILVVGSQKIVPDLDAALRRIREVVLPWENAQVNAKLGVD